MRQISGFKFRRQHLVGTFVVDFACVERKLIIEVDGSQHAEQEAKDEERTAWLGKHGFRVIRFWNNEVLGETEVVLEMILQELEDPHLNPPPARGRKGNGEQAYIPSPLRGEGQDGGSPYLFISTNLVIDRSNVFSTSSGKAHAGSSPRER